MMLRWVFLKLQISKPSTVKDMELERIADEYVTSVGLGSYLANALLKLQNIHHLQYW